MNSLKTLLTTVLTWSRRHWFALSLGALTFSVFFAVYLSVLYQQLTHAFSQAQEFVPTRIYSDVARIQPPASRSQLETRLKALGYSSRAAANLEDSIEFTLHEIDYPTYLIPENHPTIDAAGHNITFQFSGSGNGAVLQAIRLGEKELADLYLEPEVVATLARGNQSIRSYLKFADIPAPIWKAILSAEDQHFLEHSGLDPRGLARAILVNIRTRSFAQGGSTVTQQLVKNLMARRSKNPFLKFNELFLSLMLEARYEKEQILERYLNEVYLGQVGSLEIHGVAEGAKHFFGKRVDELNLAEIALMAGLIRGPGFYSPYRYKDRAIERQRWILKKMVETGQIAEEEMQAALREPIRLAPPQGTSNKAPYFTDFVKAELIRQLKDKVSEQEIPSAGFRVYTTLDVVANQAAQRAVAAGIADLETRSKFTAGERLEGALAAVDHNTGFIRALVGGRSYSQSTFNRILNMRRQIGSTFKPIVYLTALAKGEDPNGIAYGPAYPMEDAAWTLNYDRGRQSWTPKNYEKEYMGWIPLRTALAHSINVVAAKLGVMLGIGEVIKTARAIGIDTADLPAVPSLALGVAELSPVELLRAYATIANHGVQDELTVIRGITLENRDLYARFVYHPKQTFPGGPTDLLTDMLTSVFSEGTAKYAVKMGFDRPAAGKTGTTSNHRDSWFAGYTPQLTAVVWVGMDQTPSAGKKEETEEAPTKKGKVILTGATSALPIWIAFMKEALSGEAPSAFPASAELIQARVDRKTGKLADSSCSETQVVLDKYLVGHEPRGSSCEAAWPTTIHETNL